MQSGFESLLISAPISLHNPSHTTPSRQALMYPFTGLLYPQVEYPNIFSVVTTRERRNHRALPYQKENTPFSTLVHAQLIANRIDAGTSIREYIRSVSTILV